MATRVIPAVLVLPGLEKHVIQGYVRVRLEAARSMVNAKQKAALDWHAVRLTIVAIPVQDSVELLFHYR